MRIPFCAALALHCTVSLACGYSVESQRPFEREAARIQSLFLADRYAELEKIDAESRNSAVISDGQPLRGVLAAALGAMDLDCSDAPNEKRLQRLVAFRAKAKAWREAFPASETPLLIEAIYPVREAWIARGSDFAQKVAAEAWPIFHANVESARKSLDDLPESARRDPAWHAYRLEIARLQSVSAESYERLLEEGLERHPTYFAIYFEAAEAHSSKWGGTPEGLARFIDRSVARTESSLGQTLYARLKWYGWSARMFTDGTASWPRLKSGFQRMTTDFPDPWNLNNFARFACMAGDRATLRELMARIQGKVLLQAWSSMSFYQHCVEIAR